MRCWPSCILALFGLFIGVDLNAQAPSYQVKHLTMKDGLPNERVTSIVQDNHGFMWMGTRYGVARYDGNSFTHYQYDPLDSTSLSNNFAEVLLVTRSGTIWVGTYGGGLNRYDPSTDSFIRYAHIPGDSTSLSDDNITALYEDASGALWIGSRFGHIDILEEGAQSFHRFSQHFDGDFQLPPYQIWEFLEDKKGYLWAASGTPDGDRSQGGLIRVSPNKETIRVFGSGASDSSGLSDSRILSLLEDTQGDIWVGTQNSDVYRYDERENRLEFMVQVEGGWTMDLFQRAPGEFLICQLGAGLWNFDMSEHSGLDLRFEEEDFILQTNLVFDIHEAKDGSLWVASAGDGVFILYPSLNPFKESREVRVAYALIEDENDNLWIGSGQRGLVMLGRDGKIKKEYSRNDSGPLRRNSPINGQINSIDIDQSGIIWFNTVGGGLYRFQPEEESFSYYELPNLEGYDFSTAEFGHLLVDDASGKIWLGTSQKPVLFDTSSQTFSTSKEYPTLYFGKALKSALFFIDSRGSTWMVVRKIPEGEPQPTLFLFDSTKNTFKPYPFTSPIDAIVEDENGDLLIASNQGLHRFVYEQQSFELELSMDALGSFLIQNVLIDEDHFIWISTLRSLWRYTASSKELLEFTIDDGFNPVFADRHAIKRKDSTFVFAGDGGILYFDPLALERNDIPPQVAITNVSVFDEPISSGLVAEYDATHPLELSHRENDVSLDIAAMHYKNAERNAMQYRLEPYRQEWLDAQQGQSVRFTNLDPDTYTFSVRAANSDGVWSEPTAMTFTILPPLWRTWWAYAFYGLLFIAGVIAVDRIQRRRLIAKEREKTRERELAQAKEIEAAYTQLKATQQQLIQQEKMASLGQLTSGIAHEIKNPLNFVNNFARLNKDLVSEIKEKFEPDEELDELLGDLEANSQQIAKHGDRADQIVKSMMQHASDNNGKRHPVEINALVDEFVNLSYSSFQSQEPDIEIEIEKQLDSEAGRVNISPQDIGRVLQNVLGNAFEAVAGETEVRGPKSGVVRVSTRRLKDGVEIRVSDNGPGIPVEIRDKIFEPFFTTKPTGSGTGLGLSLSYDIVTQGHGGSFEVESDEGEGATFVVRLPG